MRAPLRCRAPVELQPPRQTGVIDFTAALSGTPAGVHRVEAGVADQLLRDVARLVVGRPGDVDADGDVDLLVRAMSMGKLHHAMMGTAAVAIGTAAAIPGTVVNTAAGGSDYAARSGTVTIPIGATSATVIITIKGDAVPEPDETFKIALSNPSSGSTITRAVGTGTIRTDD